jgi:phosphate transport system protein
MAKDLRRIATALTIINNLERIGDNSNSIAKIVFHIGREPLIKPLIDLPQMARIAQGMVKNSLDSYVNENLELAKSLESDDDEVDHYHSQIFRELLTYMMENTKNIKQATHLLFVSRYLERIADHATNIGEAVIYQVTGEREDLNRSTKNMKKKFNIKE